MTEYPDNVLNLLNYEHFINLFIGCVSFTIYHKQCLLRVRGRRYDRRYDQKFVLSNRGWSTEKVRRKEKDRRRRESTDETCTRVVEVQKVIFSGRTPGDDWWIKC